MEVTKDVYSQLAKYLDDIFFSDKLDVKVDDEDRAVLKDAMLLVISGSKQRDTHRKAYNLLSKVNPSFKYNTKGLETVLDSIYVFKTHDEEFCRRIINITALNLCSLSEEWYRIYLSIIKRLERYHADGAPNIPQDMTFGIEIELSLLSGTDINKPDIDKTNELFDKLKKYAQEKGLTVKEWVIKRDGSNIEITTGPGGLTNNRKGFEKLRSGLSVIMAYVNDSRSGLSIAQEMHIHIGAKKEIGSDTRQAVGFIGKEMEYYWSKLSGENGIITFEPEALIGRDDMVKNKTPFYYDEKTSTIALNTFAPVHIALLKEGKYFERLQLTIAAALAIVHNAITRSEDFNILCVGSPVYQRALYTPEHSVLLRRQINHLFGDNPDGVISFLQLLCDGNHLPRIPIDIKDKENDDAVEASYKKLGLESLHAIHNQKGGWNTSIIDVLKRHLGGKTAEELMSIVLRKDDDDLLVRSALILLIIAAYRGHQPAITALNNLTSLNTPSSPRPPIGSIYSVFEYICDNTTEAAGGITGQKIADRIGNGDDIGRAYSTIDYDIRALLYHLKLIKKNEDDEISRKTGKDARYYVPESVRKKRDQLLPTLKQFQREYLRPNTASFGKAYDMLQVVLAVPENIDTPQLSAVDIAVAGQLTAQNTPDIENLLQILNKPVFGQKKQDDIKYYTVRYNAAKISQGSLAEKLLKVYAEQVLPMYLPGKGRVELRASISPKQSLISVECYKDQARSENQKIGEGRVDIDEDINGKALRIIGMMNMAFLASQIPNNIPQIEIGKYDPIISIIKKQYKEISEIDPTSETVQFTPQGIYIRLPHAAQISLNEVSEYYRLTIIQLGSMLKLVETL